MAKYPSEQNEVQSGKTLVQTDRTLEAVLVENEQLKAEKSALKQLVRDLQSQLGAAGITDDIRDEVKIRMAAGLSQPDAVEVVRRQRAHDANLARQTNG